MARQIIIIRNSVTDDGHLSGGAVLWLQTPAALVPYAVPAGHVVPSLVPDITPEEHAALTAGTITEVYLEAGKFEMGITDAQIQQEAQGWLQYEQARLDASAPPRRYAGAYYDSSVGWVNWPQ